MLSGDQSVPSPKAIWDGKAVFGRLSADLPSKEESKEELLDRWDRIVRICTFRQISVPFSSCGFA